MLNGRRYRLWVVKPLLFLILAAFGLIWALIIVNPPSPLWTLVIPVGGTAVGIRSGFAALRRGGVRETVDGVTSQRLIGYESWRWEDIERFDTAGRRRLVFLVTKDRRACLMFGIADGRRVIWDSTEVPGDRGETHGITALLNERLAQRQGRHLSAQQEDGEVPAARR